MQTSKSLFLAIAFLTALSAQGCAVQDVKPTGPAQAQASLPNCQVMVVGTIHKEHLVNKKYPLQVFEALMDTWKPDLVLVEIRPDAFAKGHYEDGPFEMAYITWLAKARHIAVVPIDWYRASDVKAPTAADMAAERKVMSAVGPLFKNISGIPGFAQIHDQKVTRSILQAINARNRLRSGTPIWNRRQAWMEFQATHAIWQHRPKRVAVFVGFQHRPEMLAYLTQLGAVAVNPAKYLRTIGFSIQELARRPISNQVIALWQEGLVRLRKQVAQTTGFLQCSLRQKARYFQVALVQQGRCCVQQRSLRAACPSGERKAPIAAAPRPAPRPAVRPTETQGTQPTPGTQGTGPTTGQNSGTTETTSNAPGPAEAAPATTPRPAPSNEPTGGSSGTK
ncbi:MAG: hypothetical protein J7M25_07535 [Deltaproteobacteria bacterium]|nr:hypothetical protein [Deltaproteobacteria bacterium]